MELGGPEVGRGCGGRGIIHGFELLEKLGFHDWDFDYVLLDFLGDVVCGGFGLPIARDMAQKVILVGVERPAVALRRQQRLLGGGILPQAGRQCRRRGAGDQQGRRHSGEAQAFAEAVEDPGPRRDPAGRRPAQEIGELPDRRHHAMPVGRPVRRAGRGCRRSPRRCARRRWIRTDCWAFSTPRTRAATSSWCPPPTTTCAARTRRRRRSLEVVYDDA